MVEKEEDTIAQEDEKDAETEEGTEEISEAAEAAQEEEKPGKKKKVVRRRKSKKEKEKPITGALRLAVESGKVEFGAKNAIADKDAKVYVLASNTPKEYRDEIERKAKSSNVPIIEFEGNTMELGGVCGKPFPVSVLCVYEEGSSNIMELAKKK